MWAQIVNTLLGFWVTLSPALLVASLPAANNNHITGPLVITFAVVALWEINRSARVANLLTGTWLIISPLFIDIDPQILLISNIAAGVLIVIFSLIAGKRTSQYGGGWRSLFQSHPAHMDN